MKKEHLSEKDGLTHRWIHKIIQDKTGFLWIATENGLNRYDGFEFKQFPLLEKNAPIERVLSLQESNDGSIWAHLNEKTMCVLNPKTGAVRLAQKGKDFLSPIQKQNDVQVIDPKFWSYLEESSLLFLEEKALQLNKAQPQNNKVVSENKLSESRIVKYGQVETWLWNHEQLFNRSSKTIHYERFNYANKKWEAFNVWDILNLASGHAYLPIDNQGRFWFPSSKENSKQQFTFFRLPTNLTIDDWVQARLDNRGNIWINSKQGQLFRYNQNNQKLESFGFIEQFDQHLKIYEDTEHTVWLGSQNGIWKIRKSRQLFDNYLDQPFELGENPPIGYSLYYLIEGQNDNVLVVDNNLFQIDPKQRNVKEVANFAMFKNIILPLSTTHFLLKNKESLSIVDMLTYKAQRLPISNDLPIFSGDLRHKIIICEYENGLHLVLDTLTKELQQINQFSSYNFNSFWQEDKQLLWLNSKEGKVAVVHLEDLSLQELPIERMSIRDWLPKGNMLWLATTTGLKVLDIETLKVIKAYTSADGLPHDIIYSLMEANDNLWLGTHYGLCRFNPQTLAIKNFYVDDGLSHHEFNTNAILKTRNGKIWTAGLNGVNVFDPEELGKVQIDSAALHLTHFTKYNSKTDSIHVVSDLQLLDSEAFVIKAHDKPFSFQFIIKSLIDPENERYSWYLEGYEKEWAHISEKPVAVYQNVPPGNYVLRVKGNDYRGNPTKNELAINIKILQIWYKRWWAWAFYVSCSIGMIFMLYRFSVRRKLEQQESFRLKELDSIKTKLYTNITHEFRTPLTIILGMTKQLMKSDKVPAVEKQGLNIVHRNGENLLSLVNQMLDLAKLEAGKVELRKQKGDVVAFLKYLLESFHSLGETKAIRLHFLTDLESLEMSFDQDKLRQVVVNLFSNAIKFTPSGGDVYFNLAETNNRLIIKVKDTGVGIAEAQLPHIFNRFYQVDDTHTREGEGTGIGLALVRELVKLMEGNITVKSKVGKGTAFTLDLPITQEVNPAEGSTELLKDELMVSTSGKLKQEKVSPLVVSQIEESATDLPLVLIIEDNEDVAQYIRLILEPSYQVSHALNGQLGIEQAIAVIPDLIISDVMMPIKDGFEVTEALKKDERTSHIPIILLTAKADFSSKIEGLERGADAYLAKPFQQEELVVRIEKMLELRQRLQAKYGTLSNISAIPSSAPPNLEDAFLLKFKSIIEKKLADPTLDMTHLSRALAMSRSQIYRKVKALTGKSPAVFIRSIRLQKGKELLATTNLTASEVAYDVGFSSLTYFSNAFFEEFGIRPSATRK